MRTVLTLVMVAGASALAACSSSTGPKSGKSAPGFGAFPECVKGVLLIGGPAATGDLNAASGCRTPLLVFPGETTYANSYGLPVRTGVGYLVTMQGHGLYMNSLLELTTSPNTLLAASRTAGAGPTQLVFASAVTGMDTVRATVADTFPSDTGGYTVTVQPCKVPVPPITDSITHSDVITSSDCQVGLDGFNVPGIPTPFTGVAASHLYSVHMSTDTTGRQISVTAAEPVYVFIGGPRDDTFGTVGLLYYYSAPQMMATFEFAVAAGDYTLLIGSPTGASYTVTVGSEQPFPPSPSRVPSGYPEVRVARGY
jgi:hypothetical protein